MTSGALRGRRVAVTGATGFLGRAIADRLMRRGAHVIGAVRNPDRVPELARAGVEMRRADLSDVESLTRAFDGADAVVSNAALFSLGNSDWRAHHETNIQGTENVFTAIAEAGVDRVVQVSSVAVYDGRQQDEVDEHHRILGHHSPLTAKTHYSVSKALSEAVAWRRAARDDLTLTVVRPSAIYGPHDPNFTPRLHVLARSPVLPAMVHLCFVYVGDVAEAIALSLSSPVSEGKAYNVSGDSDVSLWQMLRARDEAGGEQRRRIPVPLPRRVLFDNRLAKHELGWRPTSPTQAWREIAAEDGMAGWERSLRDQMRIVRTGAR